MKQFTFIFRQGKRFLSPEEFNQRASEIRKWAITQATENRQLAPHILGDDGYQISLDGDAAPTPPISEGSVIAIIFLEATDLNSAVAIAKTHPGPRYGNSIEVREWSRPPNFSTLASSRQ